MCSVTNSYIYNTVINRTIIFLTVSNTIIILFCRLHNSLRDYAEYVKARNAESDSLLVHDPRSEEEKQQAALLAEKAAQAVSQTMQPTETKMDGME